MNLCKSCFLKSLLIRIALLQFFFGPLFICAQNRPNIIFILADDLGYGDLSCFGQQKFQTPNIDKLAENGMRFTNFYAGSTVCAPSRASLMTGKHTGQLWIRGNGEVPLRTSDTTIAQMLKSIGYQTAMAGKWGLGNVGTTGEPAKKGWDHFYGVLHHVEGHYQKPDSVWIQHQGPPKRIPLPKELYANEWFTQQALDFIQSNQNNPFFLYLSFTLPHAELITPTQYLKPFLNSDGQSIFQPEHEWPPGKHYGPQPFPKAAYAAMVSEVDEYVGRITSKLASLGLEKNTLLIFTSDNGTHVEGGRSKEDVEDFFQSSGPFRGWKRALYEGGIRVPMIATLPGSIEKGSISENVAAFWDIMPTFADITGFVSPQSNGISILPALTGDKSKQERPLYWEFHEGGYKQAVRFGDWKAIRFFLAGKPEYTELYNLHDDPGERKNLADSFSDKVEQMEAIMDREYQNSGHKLFQRTK